MWWIGAITSLFFSLFGEKQLNAIKCSALKHLTFVTIYKNVFHLSLYLRLLYFGCRRLNFALISIGCYDLFLSLAANRKFRNEKFHPISINQHLAGCSIPGWEMMHFRAWIGLICHFGERANFYLHWIMHGVVAMDLRVFFFGSSDQWTVRGPLKRV